MLRVEYLAAVGMALLSTSAAPDPTQIPVGISEEELFGTVLRDSKWVPATIEVCWENPSATSEAMRQLTQTAVKQTWERVSRVRFIGWKACVPGQKGIYIQISDERPHTKAVGNPLNKMPHGMVLNFKFANWESSCASEPDHCAKLIAVHEFGHALGFTHEQRAANAKPECSNEPADIVGDYQVTKYDMHSIMSLCNPNWMGNGQLSELDERAVRKFYGA